MFLKSWSTGSLYLKYRYLPTNQHDIISIILGNPTAHLHQWFHNGYKTETALIILLVLRITHVLWMCIKSKYCRFLSVI